jgi:hypothetical protein
MNRSILLKWSIPVVGVIFTRWFESDIERVERYYSKGFYIYLSKGLRLLAGPFPFSLGDLLYCFLIGWIIWKLVKFFRQIRYAPDKRIYLRTALMNMLWIGLLVWLVFQWCWGINYSRTNIPEQFGLSKKQPTQEEINCFTRLMLEQINATAPARERSGDAALLAKTPKMAVAYQKLSNNYPQLSYTPAAFKSSLFGVLGNYMGYSGYFNPLSGEAQVNTHMPAFVQPFTGLHEIAHQLGYAKESEASFIGFLAAWHSGDSLLKYSASLEMFLFAQGALYRSDSASAKALKKALPKAAKKDLDDYKKFYSTYQGPIDDFITWFYGKFLQFNNQPEGMHSYNRSMVYVLRYILDNQQK